MPTTSPPTDTPEGVASAPSSAAPFTPVTASARGWIWTGVLLALVVVYRPALHGSRFADDDLLAFGNDLVKSANGLWRIWASTEAWDYFPLTYTSFWIDWRLWGSNVAAFRLTNIVLHACSVLVLAKILRHLRLRSAWLAAGLFAFHPVNVASVAWIAERKNTLSLPFYLLSFLFFLRADDAAPGSREQKRAYVGALFGHLAGLLAKTSGAAMPVVLLLASWWRRGRLERRDLVRTAPFFALSGVLSLVTMWFQWHRAMQGSAVRDDGMLSRSTIAAEAVWFYLGKALIPTGLAAFYPRWQIGPVTPLSFVPLLALLTLLFFAWRARAGWGRHALFAVGTYIALLLPILGFIDVYWMRYSLVADHWQYLALIVPMAVVAEALWTLVVRTAATPQLASRILITCSVAAIGTYALMARARAALFHDGEAIWRDVVSKDKQSFVGHAGLGEALARKQRFDEAEEHLREAVRLNPGYETAQQNLGELMKRRSLALAELAQRMAGGRTDGGGGGTAAEILAQSRVAGREAALRAAIGRNPGDGPARLALIQWLADDGRAREALSHCQEAERFGGDPAAVDVIRASVLMRNGVLDEAVAALQRALRRRPDLADAHFAVGVIAEAKGDVQVARLAYGHALRLAPQFAEARAKLADLESRIAGANSGADGGTAR